MTCPFDAGNKDKANQADEHGSNSAKNSSPRGCYALEGHSFANLLIC